mmetsp:Transcript_17580/g.40833  ORF Transcript_17580/g.40833 Transcript_17580/m.40833 type:complete len:144 (+) Transcript_17580:614-1045(+)
MGAHRESAQGLDHALPRGHEADHRRRRRLLNGRAAGFGLARRYGLNTATRVCFQPVATLFARTPLTQLLPPPPTHCPPTCPTAARPLSFAGIDSSFLNKYPRVKEHKAMIASLPQVRKFYAEMPVVTKEAWAAASIDIRAFTQ